MCRVYWKLCAILMVSYIIYQAAVFHYGSISLIAEPCRSAHLRAMEIAKEAGALLSYDPNLREALWPSREEARTKILSIWDQADIVKVSEVELEFLTGIDSVEDDVVMKLWRPTMKLLLVTLGDQGCKYYARVSCIRSNKVAKLLIAFSFRSKQNPLSSWLL
jgi:fructokinase